MAKISKKGIVQVYTGDGKGKTTAAIGQAIRACGWGWKVDMVQFMKEVDSGEIIASFKLPSFSIYRFGSGHFLRKGKPVDPLDISLANQAMEKSREVMISGESDLLILDEINIAVSFGLIPVQKVIDFMKGKPPRLELILTGRYAPDKMIEIADTVTEMREIRHHFNNGIKARKGIEY